MLVLKISILAAQCQAGTSPTEAATGPPTERARRGEGHQGLEYDDEHGLRAMSTKL
jgi:hypothetical protein